MARPLVIIADPELEFIEQAKPLLIPAFGDGDNWQDVEEKLKSTYAQLWVIIDSNVIAAAVTEIEADNVHFWLAGGQRAKEWADTLARGVCDATGRKMATIRGRIGWARLLGWDIIERDGKNAFMRMDYE